MRTLTSNKLEFVSLFSIFFFFFGMKVLSSINVFHILNAQKKNTMPKSFQNGHCKFTAHTPVMKFDLRHGFFFFSNVSNYFEFCYWF